MVVAMAKSDAAGKRVIDGPRSGEFAAWHAALVPEIVPDAEASWTDVSEFALTFDGYEVYDNAERLGEFANHTIEQWKRTGEIPQNLTDLRACLFFEQRRFRHFGDIPEGSDMVYLRALVEAIREHVTGSANDDVASH